MKRRVKATVLAVAGMLLLPVHAKEGMILIDDSAHLVRGEHAELGHTPAGARRIARTVSAARGWNRGRQWRALVKIWQHESGWRHNAQNKQSVSGKHAGGIPQILGLDPNTPVDQQIEAGLRYIESRYGTPVKAWEFWQKHYWY